VYVCVYVVFCVLHTYGSRDAVHVRWN